MSTPSEHTIELGAGSGVVASIDGVVLFVADGDSAEALVEAIREVIAVGGGHPGRPVARRLARLITGEDADGMPDFGLLAATDDGLVVLLHGAVTATIVSAEGSEETLAGTSSATWADRIVPATIGTVLIAPAGLARPGASPLRLEAGVVPGGWVRVVLAASRASGPPPAEFELFPLAAGSVAARPPLPVEGVTSIPADEDDPTAPVQPEAATAVEPSEPPPNDEQTSLGLLVFDDGAAFGLDDNYVLGREPEIDEAVAAGNARPIALDDPADTVSRVHAEIRLASSDVHLIDRGSTNGTHLWDESSGAWERLAAGEPRVIRPGARGAIGRRTFVYEAIGPAVTPVGTVPRAPETVVVAPAIGSLTGEGGAVYPLDRSYVIGRDPLTDDAVREALASPIVIRDDSVSRVHAHVSVAHGSVTVRDATTTGGTFIAPPGASEWEALGPEPTVLPPGWSLRVGTHVFTFRDGR